MDKWASRSNCYISSNCQYDHKPRVRVDRKFLVGVQADKDPVGVFVRVSQNDLFVSVKNHARIRSRQPMSPRLVTKVLPMVRMVPTLRVVFLSVLNWKLCTTWYICTSVFPWALLLSANWAFCWMAVNFRCNLRVQTPILFFFDFNFLYFSRRIKTIETGHLIPTCF